MIVTIAARMEAPTPTALVVEDDAALRMLVRVNLELDGFAVDEAATIEEAEAALERLRPTSSCWMYTSTAGRRSACSRASGQKGSRSRSSPARSTPRSTATRRMRSCRSPSHRKPSSPSRGGSLGWTGELTQVLSATDFEDQLAKYLYERSEEGRAVRVGEKEVSEQAEIVRRFADLFSREQLESLRDAEQTAGDDAERHLPAAQDV